MKLWFVVCLFCAVYTKVSAQTSKDSLVVYNVDLYAQFEGGISEWISFVQEHLDIQGIRNSIDSTAYVDYGLKQTAFLEFTICEDGEVCNVEIVNEAEISPKFAEEALRVMGKSPKWRPARKNGKPVRTRFKQSIVAVL